MYLDFYQMAQEPFHITPDPRYLFLSPSHKEALASIIYGIEKRKGFISIIGEVGVGKTTILRSYLEDRANQARQKTIYIFNTKTSFESLLKTICIELDIHFDADDVSETVNKLYKTLINEYTHERNVVLILDEAQNVPVETLEHLRMLSNLETSTDKLIQVVLIGQPELQSILDRTDLRQLKQRIAIKSCIFPLNRQESIAYIRHRLEKVSKTDDPVFTDKAMKLIVDEANGIPRIINILCDNALIAGFGYQKRPVTTSIVKEVIADYAGKKRSLSFKWWSATASLALLFSAITLIYPYCGRFLSSGKDSYRADIVFNHLPAPADSLTPLHENPAPGPISAPSSVPVVTGPEDTSGDQTETSGNTRDPIQKEDPAAAAPAADQKAGQDNTLDHSAQSPEEKGDLPRANENSTAVEGTHPLFAKSEDTIRFVQKGENVSRIIRDRYGFSDARLIDAVKRCNPHIRDINIILAGERILLPPSDSMECFPGSGSEDN